MMHRDVMGFVARALMDARPQTAPIVKLVTRTEQPLTETVRVEVIRLCRNLSDPYIKAGLVMP